jgi:hypothetical protein
MEGFFFWRIGWGGIWGLCVERRLKPSCKLKLAPH